MNPPLNLQIIQTISWHSNLLLLGVRWELLHGIADVETQLNEQALQKMITRPTLPEETDLVGPIVALDIFRALAHLRDQVHSCRMVIILSLPSRMMQILWLRIWNRFVASMIDSIVGSILPPFLLLHL
jgi:hypothetical protein